MLQALHLTSMMVTAVVAGMICLEAAWCSPDTPVEGLPQVVPAAEDEVGPGVEGGAHPAQAAVTAGALQTVLVPVPVQRLQHEAVPDLPVAAGAAPRLLSGLEGHEGHTWAGNNRWTEQRINEINKTKTFQTNNNITGGTIL